MSWPPDPLAAVSMLLSAALAIWPSAGSVARARLRCLSTSADLPDQAGGSALSPRRGLGTGAGEVGPSAGRDLLRRRALLFAGLAGSAVLAAFPSPHGGLAAVTASAGCYAVLRGMSLTGGSHPGVGWMSALRLPGVNARRGTADPRLPFAIDLLAVCLRAGMPTSSALRSVASTLARSDEPGPAGTRDPEVSAVFAGVAAASELGSEPATAWADWIGHPTYGPVARAMVVTGESGSAVAGRLDGVSHQLRVAAGQHANARAARAGVALMAPLGLCFLPAFVCLGVLPVVVGIAGQVFG